MPPAGAESVPAYVPKFHTTLAQEPLNDVLLILPKLSVSPLKSDVSTLIMMFTPPFSSRSFSNILPLSERFASFALMLIIIVSPGTTLPLIIAEYAAVRASAVLPSERSTASISLSPLEAMLSIFLSKLNALSSAVARRMVSWSVRISSTL